MVIPNPLALILGNPLRDKGEKTSLYFIEDKRDFVDEFTYIYYLNKNFKMKSIIIFTNTS